MSKACFTCGATALPGSTRCARHPIRRRPSGNAFAPTRRAVLERDGHRCTHVEDGQRCPATTDLHVDHRLPLSRGGSDDMGNLTTLCSFHNLRKGDSA